MLMKEVSADIRLEWADFVSLGTTEFEEMLRSATFRQKVILRRLFEGRRS